MLSESIGRNENARLRYSMGPEIGKGAYGCVYKAWDKIESCDVAIKVIDLDDAGEIEDLHHEINAMATTTDSASFCHNLVQYFGSYVVENELWIIMEYLDGGSLADVLRIEGKLINESSISFLLKKLILALVHLHDDRRLHRDIKAGNILVSTHGMVKLADFGATGQLSDSMNKRQTRVGTPFWMAPEVIMESFYDGCADIWSTGITAIELAIGSPPLAKNMAPLQAILQIPKRNPPRLEDYESEPSTSNSHSKVDEEGEEEKKESIDSSSSSSSRGKMKFSDSFKEFVARCLQKNPMDRPSAKEVLQLAFLTSAPDEMPEELIASIKRCRDIRYNNIANQTNQHLVQKSSKTNKANSKTNKKSLNKIESKTKSKTKTAADSDGNAITLTEENGNDNETVDHDMKEDRKKREEKKKLKKQRIKKKKSSSNQDHDNDNDKKTKVKINNNEENAIISAKIHDNNSNNSSSNDNKIEFVTNTNTTDSASVATNNGNYDNDNENEKEREERTEMMIESKKKDRITKKKIKKQDSSGSSDKSNIKSSKNRNRSRNRSKEHDDSDVNTTPTSSPLASAVRRNKNSTKDSLSDDNFSFSSASNRKYTVSQASLGDDSSFFDQSIDGRFGELPNSQSRSSLTLHGGAATPQDYYNNYYDNNYYFPNDGVSRMNDGKGGGANGEDRETFFDWNFEDSSSKDMSGLMSDYLRFQGMDGREEAAFARRLASDLRRNRSRSEDNDTEDTLSSDSSSASSGSGTGTGNSSYTGSLNRTPWDNRDHSNNIGFGSGSLPLLRKGEGSSESTIFKNVVQPSLAALVEAATNMTFSNHPSSDNLLSDQELSHPTPTQTHHQHSSSSHTSIGKLCETLMNTLHELDVRSDGNLTMELVTNISSFLMEEMEGN